MNRTIWLQLLLDKPLLKPGKALEAVFKRNFDWPFADEWSGIADEIIGNVCAIGRNPCFGQEAFTVGDDFKRHRAVNSLICICFRPADGCHQAAALFLGGLNRADGDFIGFFDVRFREKE